MTSRIAGLLVLILLCGAAHADVYRPAGARRRYGSLGFAGALHEVGLPQSAVPTALFFFNVGVETGQLLFIGFVALLTQLVHRLRVQWPRWAEYVPAYAIGSIAMFWVIERAGSF